MKKVLILILPLILFLLGCEKIPSVVVDSNVSLTKVSMLLAPTTFIYTTTNQSFVTSLKLETEGVVKDIYTVLRTSDGKITYYKSIKLYDDGTKGDLIAGDKTYSAKIDMNENMLSGYMLLEYFVTYNLGKQEYTQKIAVHQFSFDNGSTNVAPEILNLVAPDTIVVQSPKSVFSMQISAKDDNGLNDITEVYFITYKPDGTTNNNKSYLLDNGNPNNGDLVAGDGIYSIIVEITPNNVKGNYIFEFRAKDRRGKLSNVINHQITVK